MYVGNCKYYKAYNSMGMSSVGCTDVSGKQLHRQVDMYLGVTSGKPMWCNCSILAQYARDMGSIPALGTIFPIVNTPTPYMCVYYVIHK